MSDFVQGQRWVVDSEPELGLGTVVSIDARAVSIFFPRADCERLYAIKHAPLTRIQFGVDDEIQLQDGSKGTVKNVLNHQGLLIYDLGGDQLIPETAIASEIKLNQPFLRLMTGQLDAAKWFYFRRELDAAMVKIWHSRLNGLLGIRANLIPHQLYVAWSACERERVRVLLADEVGLGKTIEAGMILSRLMKLERVRRALVVVPDALQVQWLVELVRRFTIKPELYCGAEHDFASGQVHLLPHSALASEEERLVAGEFDLVIVDEAHHIQPTSAQFACLDRLSEATAHLVLLTATPEQLGFESHFARLQLLDPAKYSDIREFLAEEQGYAELNQQIRALPGSRPLLMDRYQLDPALPDDKLIDQLLDCHGIGRVMFRNTRAAVAGFPARLAKPHVVADDAWETKFEWLAGWLKAHTDEKVLVICHSKDDVKACENYLWQAHGIDAALFHEDMNLIERDRAAAYFADGDLGAQVLICSEIGSEGRNFQFSHHLVCLDLPEHPDLLEQRIGRLDRIGQTSDVCIHVPFAEGSPTAQKFYWFHEVLSCIEQQSPAASAVHDEFWEQFSGEGDNVAVVEQARQKSVQLQQQIQQGRDALLEMNSCRQPTANNLVEQIAAFEQDTPLALVELASDLLNFHFEETQGGAYSLIPANNMLLPSLPGIPLEGAEVTFSRPLANAREEVLFITWDSPFILGLWELLHHSELGSASVALLPSRQLPAGKCLLEACFDVVVQSTYSMDCLPFMSSFSVRTLVLDISDKDLASVLPEDSLQQSLKAVEKKLARRIIQSKKEEIPAWFQKAEHFAEQRKQSLLADAMTEVENYFSAEVERLQRLAVKNPNIGDDEIEVLQTKRKGIGQALTQHAHLQLSAIRLIVTTES